MRTYVDAIWGWDEERQDEFVRQSIADTPPSIIVFNGQDIGQITVQQKDGGILLRDLFILPEFQGKGIGSAILTALLQEAHDSRLPVTLRVFKTNPARRLYERLDFEVDSEDATCFYMSRLPAAGE